MTHRYTYTRPDRIVPWIYGYCLVETGGTVEIWHYASDRLVHVAVDQWDAVGWCMDHSAVPKLPAHMAKRHWQELLTEEERYHSRPKRYRHW